MKKTKEERMKSFEYSDDNIRDIISTNDRKKSHLLNYVMDYILIVLSLIILVIQIVFIMA